MTLCSLAMTLGVIAFTYSPPQADLWIWAWAIFWGMGFGYLVPALGAVRGAYFGRAAYGKICGDAPTPKERGHRSGFLASHPAIA